MRDRLLSLLRVTERPQPPPGAGPDLAVFRASRRYLYYSALTWIPKQIGAFVGLLFSLAFFGSIDQPFIRAEGWTRLVSFLERITFGVGPFAFDATLLFDFFEGLAVVGYVAQLLFTGLLLKLSWELRWYMVGEEALRIREGLWFVRERTMTIANIQNMTIRQGPVQRLFGIADLEVRTAGGGSSESDEGEGGEGKKDLHIGRFRGLEDARGLRDRIRRRLIRQRGAGLGDADDHVDTGASAGEHEDRVLEAAQVLRQEARELRAALGVARTGGDGSSAAG